MNSKKRRSPEHHLFDHLCPKKDSYQLKIQIFQPTALRRFNYSVRQTAPLIICLWRPLHFFQLYLFTLLHHLTTSSPWYVQSPRCVTLIISNITFPSATATFLLSPRSSSVFSLFLSVTLIRLPDCEQASLFWGTAWSLLRLLRSYSLLLSPVLVTEDSKTHLYSYHSCLTLCHSWRPMTFSTWLYSTIFSPVVASYTHRLTD